MHALRRRKIINLFVTTLSTYPPAPHECVAPWFEVKTAEVPSSSYYRACKWENILLCSLYIPYWHAQNDTNKELITAFATDARLSQSRYGQELHAHI